MKEQKYYRVEQLDNKNQFVIKTEGSTIFQSYESQIAIYDGDGLTLGRRWDYSKTTLKHLYLFLNYYVRNRDTGDLIKAINNSTNKRKTIQEYINKGFVNYDAEMC